MFLILFRHNNLSTIYRFFSIWQFTVRNVVSNHVRIHYFRGSFVTEHCILHWSHGAISVSSERWNTKRTLLLSLRIFHYSNCKRNDGCVVIKQWLSKHTINFRTLQLTLTSVNTVFQDIFLSIGLCLRKRSRVC